jgi:hypothetical protein
MSKPHGCVSAEKQTAAGARDRVAIGVDPQRRLANTGLPRERSRGSYMVTRGLWAGCRAGWVAAVVVACVLTSASPALANWTVHSAVAPPISSGQLKGISCWSANGCIAVGSAKSRSGVQVAVAERWNGKRWTAQPPVIPAGAGATTLDGISCVSPRLCVAVGGAGAMALTERWTGGRWSVVANRGRGGLDAVSCPSRSACEAVGADVIERWNGKRWSVAHKLRSEQSLASVSCASATRCMAVGESFNESTDVNFAERYDGRRWARQPIPTPGGEEDSLTGVSCVSARFCLATGATIDDSYGDTLSVTERWNGSRWSIQNPANSIESQTLNDLSCAAANACVAVGTFTTDLGADQPLVQRWNGHRWAVQFTARPRGARGGTFAAVSCSSRRVCDAVGSLQTQQHGSHPLAEQLKGSRWRARRTVGFVGGASGALNGVSCTAAGTCSAVGDYINDTGTQETLAERETGGDWVVQPTPTRPGGTTSTLSAVSCATGSACAAVGEYCNSPHCSEVDADVPLAETWDGSKWAIVPVPDPPGTSNSQLDAVSCATPTSCIAVGYQQAEGGTVLFTPLIEAWNGSSWAIEHAPTPPGSADARLAGVSCSSPAACTAVGSFSDMSSNLTEPFVEVWDGSSWALQTPSAGGTGGRLNGVACVAPGSCVAVGSAYVGGRALIETSAGSTWSATKPPGGEASLAGVSCYAKEACLAVGQGTRSATMLALGSDGNAWTAQDVPVLNGATSGQFNGVFCPAGGRCVAVGSFATTISPSQPVIEERHAG